MKSRSAAVDMDTTDNSAVLAAQFVALRSLVDDLDYGIVVLDQDRNVQFINRAFRCYWRLPDEQAGTQQSFARLMYYRRGAGAYAVPHDKLSEYVEKQMDLIRTGEERPLNIRLADGEVIQFKCKALPNGGHLLTYGNISNFVREAEALDRLASTDAMTGLNNRRNFLVLAENEWARFQRYGRPTGLLMVDIDRFKSINDTFGHDVGDYVIKSVAEALQNGKRTSDIVGRFGGEEFCLILPEATLDSAVAAGERLRQMVEDFVITADERRIPVTISVGASICRSGMKGFGEVLKEADVALYSAKRSGRNRVCRFDTSDVSNDQAIKPTEHHKQDEAEPIS